MRTTLTLDDEIAAKLRAEARRKDQPVRVVVNDALRRGLAARSGPAAREPFCIEPRDLGNLRPGLSLDNVAELVEQVEGPLHR